MRIRIKSGLYTEKLVCAMQFSACGNFPDSYKKSIIISWTKNINVKQKPQHIFKLYKGRYLRSSMLSVWTELPSWRVVAGQNSGRLWRQWPWTLCPLFGTSPCWCCNGSYIISNNSEFIATRACHYVCSNSACTDRCTQRAPTVPVIYCASKLHWNTWNFDAQLMTHTV